MKMMAIGGGLFTDGCCVTKWQWKENRELITKEFPYTQLYDMHFTYHHCIDNHNFLRHAVPSIEESWVTQHWAIRVFSFLLAVTKVNAYYAVKYFVYKPAGKKMPTLLEFRRNLGWMLVENDMYAREIAESDPLDNTALCLHVERYAWRRHLLMPLNTPIRGGYATTK